MQRDWTNNAVASLLHCYQSFDQGDLNEADRHFGEFENLTREWLAGQVWWARLGQESAQEALIRVWKTCKRPCSRYDPNEGADLTTWLSGFIVCYALRDAWRFDNKARQGKQLQDETVAGWASKEQPADLAVQEADWAARFADRIANLPQADWQLFQMRYVHDMTLAKIADALHVSINCVSFRLDRLRHRLAQILQSMR